MPNWVGKMPEQAVAVVPFEEHEEGTGRSAHYNPGNDDRPGEYRIPLDKPGEQSRGGAETVAGGGEVAVEDPQAGLRQRQVGRVFGRFEAAGCQLQEREAIA